MQLLHIAMATEWAHDNWKSLGGQVCTWDCSAGPVGISRIAHKTNVQYPILSKGCLLVPKGLIMHTTVVVAACTYELFYW